MLTLLILVTLVLDLIQFMGTGSRHTDRFASAVGAGLSGIAIRRSPKSPLNGADYLPTVGWQFGLRMQNLGQTILRKGTVDGSCNLQGWSD